MSRGFDIPQALPLEQQDGRTYLRVVDLMRRLLAPDGCPWDREQSFETLRKYVMEEACEVIDALEADDYDSLRDELGDLAFQVVYLAELAQRQGLFGPDDVFVGLIEKLVRRHPHVFAETKADTSLAVESNWEAIKAQEKKNRPLLDNIPRSLPALAGAERMSTRVSSVGFDWQDHHGSREKVEEELGELDQAVASGDSKEIEHELGDLLFSIVNYARHLGVDPELALRRTALRFRGRFDFVEQRVKEKHGDWPRQGTKATCGVPLAEMEEYWQMAKEREHDV